MKISKEKLLVDGNIDLFFYFKLTAKYIDLSKFENFLTTFNHNNVTLKYISD